MKLSALQQSPNLLLNALQASSGTMVADATSITDPLPQSVFSDTATVTTNLGPSTSILSVADTSIYTRGRVYTFTSGGVTNAMIPFALVPPSLLAANWLGSAPAETTVGVVGLGSGTSFQDSYRLNQGNFLVVDAMQNSTNNSDYLHLIVKCNASSLIDVQTGLGAYFFTTNAYDPSIGSTAVFTPVAIKLVDAGEYEVEYIYHYSLNDVVNAELSNGAVSTTIAFLNQAVSAIYITSIQAFTRKDAALIIQSPYDYLDAPIAPTIYPYAGDSGLGVFYLDALNTLVTSQPSPIKGAYWEIATDNLFNAASVLGTYTVSNPVGNCDSISVANVEDFSLIAALSAGVYYLRVRVYNEVGVASAWSSVTSFTYTPNTPVATIRTVTDFSAGTMQVELTEANFTRAETLNFAVTITQESADPAAAPETILVINDYFLVGTTLKTINFGTSLPFYELDGGIVLSVACGAAQTFFDGVNIPIYTKQEDVEKQVSKNYSRPLTPYLAYTGAYAGDPNLNPDAESSGSGIGRILFDSDVTDTGWIRAPINGWKQLEYATKRIKYVDFELTYAVTEVDSGFTIVFNPDSNSTLTLNLPDSTIVTAAGFYIRFRITDGNGGQVNLVPAAGDNIAGGVATTVNANKLSEIYVERNDAGVLTWVPSIGDFV